MFFPFGKQVWIFLSFFHLDKTLWKSAVFSTQKACVLFAISVSLQPCKRYAEGHVFAELRLPPLYDKIKKVQSLRWFPAHG